MRASRQVEATIAFPAGEWFFFDDDNNDDDNNDDDDDDDDSTSNSSDASSTIAFGDKYDEEDESDFERQRRKRQCRGLTRCDRSYNLLSLWKIPSNSERRGSNGSLS